MSMDPCYGCVVYTLAGSGCTSDQNVLIGTESGRYITNGQNVAIGWKAMSSSTHSSYANCVSIGANSSPTRSHQVVLGGTQTHVKLPILPDNDSNLAPGELYTDGGVVKQKGIL